MFALVMSVCVIYGCHRLSGWLMNSHSYPVIRALRHQIKNQVSDSQMSVYRYYYIRKTAITDALI